MYNGTDTFALLTIPVTRSGAESLACKLLGPFAKFSLIFLISQRMEKSMLPSENLTSFLFFGSHVL